jgi:hypothetical protein
MDTTGEKKNIGELPGYIYEISAELGNTRNISLRGNFPVGANRALIDAELDKIISAISRKQAQGCLPIEKAKLRQMERSLERMIKNSEINSEKYRGHKSVPMQGQLDRENEMTNIGEQRIQIKEQNERIKELETEAK